MQKIDNLFRPFNFETIALFMVVVFTMIAQLWLFFPQDVAVGEPAWLGINGGAAYGLDGYYYAYQIREFAERGYFPKPESSPVLYLMALFSFFGNNVIATNKLFAAFLKGILLAAAFLVGKKVNRFTALIFPVVLSASFFLNYFTYEYVKNLGALTLFLFMVNTLAGILKLPASKPAPEIPEPEKTKQKNILKKIYSDTISLITQVAGDLRRFPVRVAGALLLFALTILSHKTTALWGSAAVLLFLPLRYKIGKGGWGMIITLLSVLFILAALFLPYSIHIKDLIRFDRYFSPTPECYPCSFVARKRGALYEVMIYLSAATTLGVLVVQKILLYRKKKGRGNGTDDPGNGPPDQTTHPGVARAIKTILKENPAGGYLNLLFGLSLVLFLNPFTNAPSNETAYRLLLLVFIPGSFFLAVALSKGVETIGQLLSRRSGSSEDPAPGNRIPATVIVIAIATAGLLLQLNQSAHFYKRTKNEASTYKEVVDQIENLGLLRQNSLLIAHQGLDYYYWYYTGKKAFHFMPEQKHRDRPLYRVLYKIDPDQLAAALKPDQNQQKIWPLSENYLLVEEKSWEFFLDHLAPGERGRYYNWRNPWRYRERFLLRTQQFRQNKPGKEDPDQNPDQGIE